MRLGRPHEPSSGPSGVPSPGEVEADGSGNGRSKRKGQPRAEKRVSEAQRRLGIPVLQRHASGHHLLHRCIFLFSVGNTWCIFCSYVRVHFFKRFFGAVLQQRFKTPFCIHFPLQTLNIKVVVTAFGEASLTVPEKQTETSCSSLETYSCVGIS